MKKSSKVFWSGVGSVFILMVILAIPFRTLHAGQKIAGNDKIITKTEAVSSFENVDVSGDFDVTINPGTPSKVSITTDENIMPYVQLGVSRETLKIGIKSGMMILSSNSQKAVITTDKFRTMSMMGNSKLDAKKIKEEVLDLTLSGNSVINLAGVAKKLTINLRGNATVNAKDLKADNVTITGAGNLDITVRAAKTLSMTAAGKSDVKYYGNPEVSRTAFGFVTIQKVGD